MIIEWPLNDLFNDGCDVLYHHKGLYASNQWFSTIAQGPQVLPRHLSIAPRKNIIAYYWLIFKSNNFYSIFLQGAPLTLQGWETLP